jgi:hypothetical protein
MALPTNVDELHAAMYATATAYYDRFNSPKFPFNKNLVEWRPATTPSFRCASANLQDQCNKVDGDVFFTQKGCDDVSCFPYTVNGDVLTYHNRWEATNPWCFQKLKKATAKNPQADTFYHEWFDNKCTLQVPIAKWYALYPNKRRETPKNGITNVPPFIYVNQKSDIVGPQILMSKEYCDHMKISYRVRGNGMPECYKTNAQEIAEFFLGSLYREFK